MMRSTSPTSFRPPRAFSSGAGLIPAALALALLAPGGVVAETAQWPQWGGPNRDFTCPDAGLADRWPESGPKKLWSHEIGDGFATIVCADGRLYTMCRRGDEDAVVAYDAKTGETLWETRYAAPIPEKMLTDFGTGGRSTPALEGDRLFTMGATAILSALDTKSGKVLWSKDLRSEMNASVLGRGYGASPLIYKDLVILPIGGPEQGVVAFRQDNGEVVWKSATFSPGYPSPFLARIGGKEQLVIALGKDGAGLDPDTGKTLWTTSLEDHKGALMSTPVLGGDNILFCSSAYEGGSAAYQLSEEGGQTAARQLWFTRKLRVHHGNVIRIGDYVYATGGDFGPAFLMAINVHDGEIAWRERGYPKSTFVLAGQKLLILDENGRLMLASVSPEGIQVHSEAKLLEHQAWSAPTLVGTNLYLRDRKTIMALDLSPAANAGA